jgi:hypothetical protein
MELTTSTEGVAPDALQFGLDTGSESRLSKEEIQALDGPDSLGKLIVSKGWAKSWYKYPLPCGPTTEWNISLKGKVMGQSGYWARVGRLRPCQHSLVVVEACR